MRWVFGSAKRKFYDSTDIGSLPFSRLAEAVPYMQKWTLRIKQVDTKSIGGQIRQYRKENALSINDLSQMTGFDQESLASWEENITAPDLIERMRLVIFEIVK